jgi:hypothetical protein
MINIFILCDVQISYSNNFENIKINNQVKGKSFINIGMRVMMLQTNI